MMGLVLMERGFGSDEGRLSNKSGSLRWAGPGGVADCSHLIYHATSYWS